MTSNDKRQQRGPFTHSIEPCPSVTGGALGCRPVDVHGLITAAGLTAQTGCAV